MMISRVLGGLDGRLKGGRVAIAAVVVGAGACVAAALPPVLPEVPARLVQPQPQRQAEPTARSGARIEISTSRLDFGSVWENEPPEGVITIRNVGTEPLTLSGERGSCGCTVPKISPRTIEPGGEGVMKITFDPRSRQGPQPNKFVTVQTNDPTTPQIRVEVNVNVRQLVAITPRTLNFREVGVNEMRFETISVFGRTPDFDAAFQGDPREGREAMEFEISKVVVDESAGGALEIPKDMQKRGFVKRVDFEVMLPPNSRIGSHSSMMRFTTTDERVPTVNANARAMVLGDIRANARRLMLGQVRVDQVITREVLVTSNSGMAFDVTEATVQGGLQGAVVTAEPVDAFRDAWRIIVSGTVAPGSPTLRGDLMITTDRENEPVIRIQYFGYNSQSTQPNAASNSARALPARSPQTAVPARDGAAQ